MLDRENDMDAMPGSSREYWDERHRRAWEDRNEPQQSRDFALLALESSPRWLWEEVRIQGLSVAHWGCAQGDGTAVLQEAISPSRIVGIDFSSVAVEQASARFPHIEFLNEDWTCSPSDVKYDIVFSSNSVEHFHKPQSILSCLCDRALKAIVLLIPYDEVGRDAERFASFLADSVPADVKDRLILTWSRVVYTGDHPNSPWLGDQVLLVYADKEWLEPMSLSLEDIQVQIADSERGLAVRDERIEELGRAVARLEEAAAVRDERIEGLEGRVDGLTDQQATRLGLSEDELQRLQTQSDVQSMTFMVEVLPTFWNHLQQQPPGQYSVLDIGPGSGAGTQLLAHIHHSDFLGYPLTVDAIDLTDTYLPYLREFGPDINRVLNGDIFLEPLQYDYCICSHVVEHVEDPEAFVLRLTEISRLATFVTAPFEEPPWLQTPGHVNVFDINRLKSWQPTRIEIRDSFGWGNQYGALKVFLVELPGLGKQGPTAS